MANLPYNLLPRILEKGMVMPQIVLPVPASTSVSFEATVEPCTPLIVVGFSFSAVDSAGNLIESYDFSTGKGITWKGVYRQLPELLPDRESYDFYITKDYLNQYVPYGPRVITKSMEVTVTNTLDSLVYFSMTLYGFQVYLADLLDAMGYSAEEKERILKLYCPGQLMG